MTTPAREQLIVELQDSCKQISTLLMSVADNQDWRPDPERWSFRDIAAHLAVCEKECLQTRIKEIASGVNPQYEFYSNTGRDFSHLDLPKSLNEWAVTRQEMFDFFRALPEEKLALTAHHATFGVITVVDYLRLDLGHDRDHMQELEQMLAEYKATSDSHDS